MDKFFVKSKKLFIDQFDKIRLFEDEYYELLREYEDSYEIIDETDKIVVLGKENFYEIEES